MNKSMSKKGTTLNKNIIMSENLNLDNLTVHNNIILPIHTDGNNTYPLNPQNGTVYLKRIIGNPDTFEIMIYYNNAWN